MRIGKRKLAHIEIFEIAAYIAEDNVNAAARFFSAVERTLDRTAEVPKIGRMQKFRGQGDLRMWPVKGFPKVLIFYIATPDEIDVVRVIHSARTFIGYSMKKPIEPFCRQVIWPPNTSVHSNQPHSTTP